MQPHAPSGSLKEKLLDKLQGIVSGDNDDEQGGGEEPRKYSYSSKKKQKEEVSNLILTIFVVGAAAWPVPEEVKPTKDEMAPIAEHMTSILARHNLLLGKLSGDALDVVAIIAAGAAWYSRVAPELRRLRGNNGGGGSSKGSPDNEPPEPPAAHEAVSPISRVSARTGQYLNDVLNSRGEGGAE